MDKATTRRLPSDYETFSDADGVRAEDSASHSAGLDHILSSSEEPSLHSLSVVSSAGQSMRCFLHGEPIQKSDREHPEPHDSRQQQ